MALYIAYYLADTAHLRAAQSGAYLHLIMYYWQHGAVPDDNWQLAAIARMTDQEWKKSRPMIEAFFQMPGWHHRRIDAEIIKADVKYELRATAGKKGGQSYSPKGKQKGSNASSELEQTASKTEAKRNHHNHNHRRFVGWGARTGRRRQNRSSRKKQSGSRRKS